MSSKGQITIPANYRKNGNLVEGDEFLIEKLKNGDFLLKKKRDIFELFKDFPRPKIKKAVPVEEMDEAIGKAIAKDYAAKFGKPRK